MTADIYGRKSIRSALKAWSDGRKLGRHPLAATPVSNSWRQQQGYSDSAAGRGLALRERLQTAVDNLRPTSGTPDPSQKAWRAYFILTEQYLQGRSPQWVAAQLHIAKRTYHREQQTALDRLASQLQGAVVQETGPPPPFLAPPLSNRPFIGRDTLVTALVERLTGGAGRVALHGLPGVGKTSLLLEVAHHPTIRQKYRDGILWAGLGQQPDLLTELGRWAEALSLPARAINQTQTVPARTQLIHDALSSRRVLLIIDDAWTLEAGLALRLGGATCAQLLSTRMPDVAFDFAGDGATAVAEFDTAAGAKLLSVYRTDFDEETAQQIVERVGGLPLGLHLVGRHLRRYGRQGVADVLHSPATRLGLSKPQPPLTRHPDLPIGTPQSLQNTIDLTVRTLPAATQQTLAALALLLPKPVTFAQEMAQAITAASLDRLLDLVEVGLVEHAAPDRYTLHQTIHDYATQLPLATEAVQRHIDWAVAYVETFAQDETAVDREFDNLLHGLDAAAKQADAASLTRGIVALDPLLAQRSRLALAERYLSAAAALIDEDALPELAARLKIRQSINARLRGEPATGKQFAAEAQAIGHHQGLQRLEADAWYDLCAALIDMGETRAALEAGDQARRLYAALGATADVTKTEGHVGLIYLHRGDLDQAEDVFNSMKDGARAGGDRHQEASSLHSLSLVHFQRAQYTIARDYAERALVLYRDLGSKTSEARTLELVGNYFGSQDQNEQAIAYLRRALALAQEVGDLSAAHIMSNLSYYSRLMLRLPEAEEYARRAVQLSQRSRRKRDEASATIRLTQVLADMGAHDEARQAGDRALALAGEIQEWWYEVETLAWLGWIAVDSGDDRAASAAFARILEMQPEPKYASMWLAAHSELAQIALHAGETAVARDHIDHIFTHHPPDEVMLPRAALCCYEVCLALGDTRAEMVLAVNAAALRQVAEHITHAAERRAFLQDQPTHRALLRYVTIALTQISEP